jgi:hypothetical protein
LTDATVPVLIVSLARATERRAKLSEQLATFNVPFEFFDAVDAADLSGRISDLADSEAIFARYGRPLGDKEIACSLTHKGVYRRILESDLDGAIILEDDVSVTPWVVDALRFFSQNALSMRDTKRVFHLEAFSRPYAPDLMLRRRGTIPVSRGFWFAQPHRLYSGPLWGAAGYYITRGAVAGLLSEQRVKYVCDEWGDFMAEGLFDEIWFSSRAVFTHPDEGSMVEAERSALARAGRAAVKPTLPLRAWRRVVRGLKRHVYKPVLERFY